MAVAWTRVMTLEVRDVDVWEEAMVHLCCLSCLFIPNLVSLEVRELSVFILFMITSHDHLFDIFF